MSIRPVAPIQPAAGVKKFLYGPAAERTDLMLLRACNTGAGVSTIRVFLIPYGGVEETRFALYYDLELDVGATLLVESEGEQGLTLEVGDKIQVESDTGDVAFSAGVLP